MTLLEQVKAAMSQPQSGIDEQAYQTFLNANRLHQSEALNKISTASKGQVIIPTGTGKTRIQVAMLVGDMIQKYKQQLRGVYVIASHRLLLNKQLMDEFMALCMACKLPFNALYVGSARQDDKEVYDNYFANIVGDFKQAYTTAGPDIKAFMEETKAANRNLIVVSTYHSFDRLTSIGDIDICAYDEAHNTTEENFQDNIKEVYPQIKRNYFFTATRKVCAIYGHGMENTDIYGEVLCEVGPRTMIEAGEMVRPRVITMILDNEHPTGIIAQDDQHMLVKTVMEAFTKHKEALKKDSADPDKVGAKLLVSFVGSDELALVQDDPDFKTWATTNNVKVYSFSTKYGSINNFEEEVNRNKVYDEMKDLQDTDDCIMMHIDILAEGINLPSITGVLLMRHLNEIKLFQTLGRALRLMKTDRNALYSQTITPQELTKYLKPYAYLILPMHFQGMESSSEDMKQTIRDVIATYGIPIEEFLPTEDFRALDIESLAPVTDCRKIAKTKKDYPLLTLIQDFVMESFVANLPTDPQQKYDALLAKLSKET